MTFHHQLTLQAFVAQHVTKRNNSLFESDMARHKDDLAAVFGGKSVLVIGGAGSIGAAFIKELLLFLPSRLVVVDHNENALAELVRDLRSSLGVTIPPEFSTYPLDYGSAAFERLFRARAPFKTVVNFAAHKHVRSEKDRFSIEAMLETNVFKTKHLLDLLAAHPPERFFCVSTDKASNPANIMGASKKLMEQLLMAYASQFNIVSARFANVAFSNGSLLEGFLQRLDKKQPLSAPYDIQRYFFSGAEAAQLCLLACALGQSGEVFFPILSVEKDLESFSVIAEKLLLWLGLEAEYCASEQEAREKAAALGSASKTWPVYFFQSDTSGEKAAEAFFEPGEQLAPQRFSKIGVISACGEPPISKRVLPMAEAINEIKALFQKESLDKAEIVQLLQHFLPGFAHKELGKNLDQKM